MTVPAFRPDFRPENHPDLSNSTPDGEVDRRSGGPTFPGNSSPSPGDAVAASEASRFRRPERPRRDSVSHSLIGDGRLAADDATGEAPASDPTGVSTLTRASSTGFPGVHGVSEPLAALAAAFQANAEALRRSHELQAELGRALQRADRSDVMVQNTAALNETFKGLTQVQRSLIHSVDAADEATRVHRWFLPTLVLASLAVVGAGLWLVVTRMEQVENDFGLRGDVATQLAAARREGEAFAKDGLVESFATERRAIEARLHDRDEDLRAAKADAAASQAKVKQLDADLVAASGEIQGARNDTMRAKALEGELNQLRIDAAVKGPEAERLRIELEGERRTVSELRRRLADVSMGRIPTADGRSADRDSTERDSADRDSADRRELDVSTRDPVDVVKDRRVLEVGRTRMNEILKSSAAGRADYLQVTALESVAGLRVAGVTAVRYGAGGKVMSTYKARDLRITVDRSRRVVEFAFSDGTLEYAGSSLPFPGGAMTVVVAEGDQVPSWLQSGLTFVGSR